jgi:hypothetical protein
VAVVRRPRAAPARVQRAEGAVLGEHAARGGGGGGRRAMVAARARRRREADRGDGRGVKMWRDEGQQRRGAGHVRGGPRPAAARGCPHEEGAPFKGSPPEPGGAGRRTIAGAGV